MTLRPKQIDHTTAQDGAIITFDASSNVVVWSNNTPTAVLIPSGTSAQRPSVGITGHIRFNTASLTIEYFDGTSWIPVASNIGNVGASAGWYGLVQVDPNGFVVSGVSHDFRIESLANQQSFVETSSNSVIIGYNDRVTFTFDDSFEPATISVSSTTNTTSNLTINEVTRDRVNIFLTNPFGSQFEIYASGDTKFGFSENINVGETMLELYPNDGQASFGNPSSWPAARKSRLFMTHSIFGGSTVGFGSNAPDNIVWRIGLSGGDTPFFIEKYDNSGALVSRVLEIEASVPANIVRFTTANTFELPTSAEGYDYVWSNISNIGSTIYRTGLVPRNPIVAGYVPVNSVSNNNPLRIVALHIHQDYFQGISTFQFRVLRNGIYMIAVGVPVTTIGTYPTTTTDTIGLDLIVNGTPVRPLHRQTVRGIGSGFQTDFTGGIQIESLAAGSVIEVNFFVELNNMNYTNNHAGYYLITPLTLLP